MTLNAFRFDVQKAHGLAFGELRDRDDQRGAFGRLAVLRLLAGAHARVGRRHDEWPDVVHGGDRCQRRRPGHAVPRIPHDVERARSDAASDGDVAGQIFDIALRDQARQEIGDQQREVDAVGETGRELAQHAADVAAHAATIAWQIRRIDA